MPNRISHNTIILLGLASLFSGCASDKLSTDYLQSRAVAPLRVPSDLNRPEAENGERPVSNLSEQELKALHPQQLLLPPKIVDATTPVDSIQPSAKAGSAAELKTDTNGVTYLQISARYDQAWSRVRLALMSSGFTITDMDRSKGQFYIRYRDPEADKAARDEFVLNLLDVSGGSRLLVRSQEGEMLSDTAAQHILKLIRDNI
jgi:uncharacterized lipoprotein